MFISFLLKLWQFELVIVVLIVLVLLVIFIAIYIVNVNWLTISNKLNTIN